MSTIGAPGSAWPELGAGAPGQPDAPPADPVERPALLAGIFALTTAAGGAHLAVAGHGFEDGLLYGGFFVTVAAAQLALAALIMVPALRSLVAVAGVLGNFAVVATYVLSRTVGVPVGWHAWKPEEAGALDLSTTVVELALIGCLLQLVPPRLRPWIVNFLCVCALAAWAWRLTVLGS
ncbi:MAG: hypothetical protein H0V32_12800 [Nocardioidaceae bacterium]|nr:hypothetical protein [Nocardioidaceae bacterium]